MKFSFSNILLLLVLGAGGFLAYRHFSGADSEEQAQSSSQLPFTTSLTNRENKTISATVVGRSATEVQLIKPDDPRKTVYSVPLATFNAPTRKALEKLPVTNASTALGDLTRRDELAKIQKRLKDLTDELKNANSLKTEDWRKQQKKEIDQLTVQLRKLKAEPKKQESHSTPEKR
jgi:hypothetical protein